MKSLGYITLTEAEEISGIKADTLKKRCQEGQITGAVKQGNTWFVPRNQIINTEESPTDDIVLSTIATIAEAGIGTSITLFIGGTIVEGDLIPAKEYFKGIKEKIKISPQKVELPEEIYKMFDLVFESFEKKLPQTVEQVLEKKIVAIHIKNITCKSAGISNNQSNPEEVMRIKLNAIDGFIWGRTD